VCRAHAHPGRSKFRDRGSELLSHHELSDQLIFLTGTVNYYEKVLSQKGGLSPVQSLNRLYLVPGRAMGCSNGTSSFIVGLRYSALDEL